MCTYMYLLVSSEYDLNMKKNDCSHCSLVIMSVSGWWFEPLWKIWKSMERMTSHIVWKNNPNVPNHQSVIYIYTGHNHPGAIAMPCQYISLCYNQKTRCPIAFLGSPGSGLPCPWRRNDPDHCYPGLFQIWPWQILGSSKWEN